LEQELRSVEVSYFIQQTEDEEKVTGAIRRLVGPEAVEERQEAEGHFGNRIVWVRFHLVGQQASDFFSTLMSIMAEDSKKELLVGIASSLDEHGSLYMRLNKQLLLGGEAVSTSSDPVRVKVKPRRPPKGDAPGFYARLVEQARA
jgi:RNA binding exosome subunit